MKYNIILTEKEAQVAADELEVAALNEDDPRRQKVMERVADKIRYAAGGIINEERREAIA